MAQCGSPSQADRASRQEQALITTLQPGLPPQCTCQLFFGIPRKLHIQSSSTRGLHFSIVLVFCDGHPALFEPLCWQSLTTLPLLSSPREVCRPYKSTRSRFFVAAIKSFVLPNLSLSWSRAKMTGCCQSKASHRRCN